MNVHITNNGVINISCSQCFTTSQNDENSLNKSTENQDCFLKVEAIDNCEKKEKINKMEIETVKTSLFDMPGLVTPFEVDKMRDFVDTLKLFSKQSFARLVAKTVPEMIAISTNEIELLKRWTDKTKYEILYWSSRDGMSKRDLMKKCEGHKNTCFLVQYDKENVIVLYFGDPIPKQPSAGPAFLDAKNHFLGMLKHSTGVQPFRLKRINWSDITFAVGASDEYVDRVLTCKHCAVFKTDYTYFFHDLSKYTCLDDKSLNFKKYFSQGGTFQEIVCIEMM
ncbi:hypothetical protein EIN_497510 [Entamoeba invadens IP1]|uniref:TLDc domain-containing protein n=1 Tax=Entamoeba invadens IP1 TaxID=370355 RepID=A0A0A1UDH0_ENTIV|nr:hypothetical protein EIN_497510 [Entamoeba invadens IP1]ELP94591.1 hypothetical protein EIN_497510 [Entamoeba invadens IP1]|eukprot:XP_004261362.1 hypothetical protein EIN_497510 [Entamoeba invadens IP1]